MIVAAWAGIRFLKGFDIFGRNTVYYAATIQSRAVGDVGGRRVRE